MSWWWCNYDNYDDHTKWCNIAIRIKDQKFKKEAIKDL